MRVVALLLDNHEGDLKELAEIFYHFTPQIALRGGEAVYLEISQCRQLYSESQLLADLKQIFIELKLHPRIGIGASPSTAFCHAHYGTAELSHLPLNALAIFFDPFAGGKIDLELVNKMVGYLHTLGVKTVEALLELAPDALASRFGISGAAIHQALLRSDAPIWPRFILEEAVIEKSDFETEVKCEQVEPILFVIQPLLKRLLLRLSARGQALKALRITLVQEPSSVVHEPLYAVLVQLTLAQPSFKTLFSIIKERLAAAVLAQPLAGSLNGVQLEVTETVPAFSIQKDLFHPKREEQVEAYAQLIHRLQLKLGSDNAFRASLNNSYIPEHGWKRAEAAPGSHHNPSRLPQRPLRLFNPPKQLRWQEGRLLIEGHWLDCSRIDDPEIIFSDWWAQLRERIYYRVDAPHGPSYWVYRATDGYYLHGVFD